MIVYGIPNCNTVKKATQWLQENNKNFEFYDYKKRGVPEAELKRWMGLYGWEAIINKKGTTWRQLPPEVQQKITSSTEALQLMTEKPSVIRRPIIEFGEKVLVGFNPAEYEAELLK